MLFGFKTCFSLCNSEVVVLREQASLRCGSDHRIGSSHQTARKCGCDCAKLYPSERSARVFSSLVFCVIHIDFLSLVVPAPQNKGIVTARKELAALEIL